MSKLSFRARALDASKPMPIFMAEELPDLPDYSAINRAVPQMPSGMEKEEECEHHLQRAICAGLIIPTPEVADIPDREFYDRVYPANYKQPRQLIHMQPFSMEQDIPDYDMDSEDERWLQSQAQRLDLSPLKFEEMMDRLEKSSGQTVVTLNEAKALLKEDDDLIIAVFDYWLNKRLKTQHPLILTVRTEQRAGIAANNPYLAFRRRTEKMQTRKNRKNDETSYEKMLKLRRDLHRAVTLLELVKKREKMKREHVHLTVEIFEKRFHARDFSGAIYAEAAAIKAATRPAFTPIFHNHYTNQAWSNKAILKDEVIPRKEKRQYKKRKHKSLEHSRGDRLRTAGIDAIGAASSDEETMPQLSPEPEEVEDEGQFAFRRNKLCSYHMPLPQEGNWPWCSREENGSADKRFRFTLTSLSHPRRCVGFARRRVGRGGRIILDRISTDHDDFWRTLDFSIVEPKATPMTTTRDYVHNNNTYNFGNSDSASTDNIVKSEVISDYANGGSGPLRTQEVSEGAVDIKTEAPSESGNEKDEMVEILRSVRRDWLHFRPKTPPPDAEPPCYLLPESDSYFVPSALGGSGGPFSIEIQSMEESPSTLLDTSPFLTDPFLFDCCLEGNIEDVPVTDTRQPPPPLGDPNKIVNVNVNVAGLNTLTTPSVNDNNNAANDINAATSSTVNNNNNHSNNSNNNDNGSASVNDNSDGDEEVVVGCSRFHVRDLGGASNKVTSTCDGRSSPSSGTDAVSTATKFNVVAEKMRVAPSAPEQTLGSTNGLRSQFGLDVRTKNKLSYAYSGGVGYSNTTSGGSTLSLHTSAHTLTLNSHSANILEIPIGGGDVDADSKQIGAETASSPAPNTKTKAIVRKNNLVMEVT